MKVLIIGGGASGMMAALSAAEDAANHVTLLERQARVGRKLLATGNGRCNLSNLAADGSQYYGAASFVRPALERFSVQKTLDFFHSLGLITTVQPGGRVYPLSDQANSVVDVLRFALAARGADVQCGCEVRAVRKKARGWQAECADGQSFFGDKLIVAAGGCAGRKLGGTEDGYRILQALGHSCTALRPSLTQIRTEPEFVRALKGVRADAALELKIAGRRAAGGAGEVQFTEYGVSGPAAFELSRAVATGAGEMVLLLDLLRGLDRAELEDLLRARRAQFSQLAAEALLAGMLHSRLGKVIVKRAGLDGQAELSQLTDAELAAAAAQVKCFALPVAGVMGMDGAQVTAGGIRRAEFDPATLESRIAPGVFATGEVLDVDGECGGFNLQWAWSSGYVAGKLGKREDGV